MYCHFFCIIVRGMAEYNPDCSICGGTYTDPKLLLCFHAYCKGCVQKLEKKDQQGLLSLTCPTCQQVTPSPAGGLSCLQPAFHLIEELEKYNAKQKGKKIKLTCKEHSGKETDLYCETCSELVCHKCTQNGGKHSSHNCVKLDKAFEKYKIEISDSMEPLEKHLTITKKALAQVDSFSKTISSQQTAVEAEIADTYRKLHEQLDARQKALTGQLHEITRRKLQALEVQRKQLEATIAKLSTCLGFVTKTIDTNKGDSVLPMKKGIVNQVNSLTTGLSIDLLRARATPEVSFFSFFGDRTSDFIYGQISAPSIRGELAQLSERDVLTAKGKQIYAAIKQAYKWQYNQPTQEFVARMDDLFSKCRLHMASLATQCSLERRREIDLFARELSAIRVQWGQKLLPDTALNSFVRESIPIKLETDAGTVVHFRIDCAQFFKPVPFYDNKPNNPGKLMKIYRFSVYDSTGDVIFRYYLEQSCLVQLVHILCFQVVYPGGGHQHGQIHPYGSEEPSYWDLRHHVLQDFPARVKSLFLKPGAPAAPCVVGSSSRPAVRR